MNKKANRALSILLALIMIVGLLPISAFAENDAPTTGTDIAIENMDGKEEDTAKEGASPSDPGELPGTGEGKEQGDNSSGEDKTAESTPSPEPSKAPAKQAAPAPTQGDPTEEQPQPASYTLTLKADPAEGGTVEGGGSYGEGTEVTVKATANDGYVFAAWYVEPEEQRDAEERRDEDKRSEDAEYTFTLNADLALCAVFTQQQPDEQTPAMPTDAAPGENTDDEPGDTGDDAAGGKQEAPAGYTFTVTFDANGHGEAPEAVSVESGKSITAPEAPEAEGYVFTGWYAEAACETLWDFDADTVSADLTLYAGWEEAPALALRGMSAAPALRDGAKGVKYNINVVKNIPGGEFWLTYINYELYPSERDKAEAGVNIDIDAKPDAGMEFAGAILSYGDGQSMPLRVWRHHITGRTGVSFTMPASDVTVTPCFVRASSGTGSSGYRLNFVYDSSQGELVRDSIQRTRAPEGDGVSVFAWPRDGYTVDQVQIWDTSNNKEVPIETLWPSSINGDAAMYAFTFQMPKGHVEVRVSFKRMEGWRALSCSVGEHGSVRLIGRNESIKDEGSGPTTLYMAEEPGRHCKLEIIPDSGYELGEVRFTNAGYSSYVQGETTERTYYFEMPDKEAQISVSFVPGSYHRATLTMSGPGNGATLNNKGGAQQIAVTASAATDYKEILTGTELWVSPNYGTGYFVEAITVTRASGQSFTVEAGEIFFMPPEAVTIKVQFAENRAPRITTSSLPAGTVGNDYDFYFKTDAPTEYSPPLSRPWFLFGSLPPGLDFNENTGHLFGTAEQAGSYTIEVTARNSKGSDSKWFTLVINEPTYYDVTVDRMPENGGTVSGAGRYTEGDRVLLSAKPEEGFAFGGWYQGVTLLSDQAEDYELTDAIKRAYELEAVFYPLQPFSVALRTADSTMGKVSLTVNGGAAQTGESISQTLYEGSSVTFEAIPEMGYAFKEWRGASGLANPHSVSSLDQAYDLTAVFVKPYPLWIGDTQVDSSNLDNILGQTDSQGRPTAAYDPDTKTLTLHNPTIGGVHDRARIYSEDSLTISGELTIGSSDRGVAVYTRGDGALNTLTIAAGSSIAITSDNEAIYAERANVHIKGGTLTAASGYRAVNIKYRGNFIMDGGDVSLSAPNIALIAWKGGSSQTPYSGEHCITVGGGVIRAYSETEDPFLAGDGVISYPANYRAVDAENNVLTLGSNQSSFGVKGTTITIEPKPVSKPVNVTVTGKTASEDYDGTEKSVSGFDFTAKDSDDGDVSGVTVTLKSAHADAASIAKTNAGDYDMGLQAEYFEITLPDGYTLGTVTVSDGKLSIAPYKLVVELSGKRETKPFNNAEQSVTGFTVALQGTLPAPMQYTEADVDDNGSAVAKGTQPGTYPMGLDASKFTNKNKNFDVMFIVAQDGQLVIEPAQPTGQVEADPVSLSFGSVQQGYTSITPKPVTIRNNTAASVTISALGGLTAFEATAMDASAQPVTLPYTLPAGESINLAVHPKSDLAANDYSETLTVAYNDGTDQTLSVALSFTVTGTPPQPITKHTVTYIVVNGTWADGTNGPKTEEVEDGQSPSQIPTGMIASEGFEGGAWSPDPTSATITDTASFTYTFTAKQPQPTTKHTVTYIVVNGTWADGTNGPKTEEVEDGQSPTQIPTGMIASEGFEGGAWSPDPTNATITDTASFTYTFTAKQPQPTTKHTVTYIVVNGTWADGTTTPKTEEVEDGQSPTQIPTGMIASEGFEGGAWSPDPTSATITDTASFTYTFTAKQNPPGPVTVTGIKLNSGSAKKVYTEGEALDVTGLTLEVSKSDGSKSTVDVTAAMISGFDSSKTGTQTLTVSYEGFTATYEVEVKAKTNPPVTTSTISYNLNGGTLNGKTGTVTIQAENGTTITLPTPTREGYTFDYWEGSRYNAGDSYTVNDDHTFTAQWKKNSTTPGTSDPGKTSPKTGDESNLALWSSLMFLSVAAMFVLLLYARKRKTEK